MKKNMVIVVLVIYLAFLCSCSVSFPAKMPQFGIYYCEELRITIDFDKINEYNSRGGILHYSTGDCHEFDVLFDYGTGVSFYDFIEEDNFFIGTFSYSDNKLYVEEISSDTIYEFNLTNTDICCFCD